jgi:hypothetical protein
VYDARRDAVVMAYGNTRQGLCLNDCWAYFIATETWSRYDGILLTPRTQCASILIDRDMFMFGGVNKSDYFSDLHSINLDTGQLTRYDSSSVSPRARTHLFSSDDFLYIFGGFDGRQVAWFDKLHLRSGKWSHLEPVESGGRSGAVVARAFDSKYYIFGDTTGHPLLKFDTQTELFEVLKCGGLAPPPDLRNSMIAAFAKYLIIVGGERDSPFTYVYALDIERGHWFTLTVLPDGKNVTLDDGNIKNGMFQLPREHSASFVYSTAGRLVVSLMGSRLMEPPPVHVIHLADAIATLNVKSDMLRMLGWG